jgi:hypothetical protein
MDSWALVHRLLLLQSVTGAGCSHQLQEDFMQLTTALRHHGQPRHTLTMCMRLPLSIHLTLVMSHSCMLTHECTLLPAPSHNPVARTQAWSSLPGSVRSGGRPSREEALQAVAVLNRVRRLLSETSGTDGKSDASLRGT